MTATLGTNDDAQRLESFQGEQKKRFMRLHYNFPPFSVGETGRMTGVGRREIGHGALAERSISAVLPTEEESPYAIRIVSRHSGIERLFVDGFGVRRESGADPVDAGIPIKAAVLAGVAMGLGEGRRELRDPDRHCRC